MARIGEISPLWQKEPTLAKYEYTLAIFDSIGQIFTAVISQISNKLYSHLVTLTRRYLYDDDDNWNIFYYERQSLAQKSWFVQYLLSRGRLRRRDRIRDIFFKKKLLVEVLNVKTKIKYLFLLTHSGCHSNSMQRVVTCPLNTFLERETSANLTQLGNEWS